ATLNDAPSPEPSSGIVVCDLGDVTDTSGNVTGWAYTPLPSGVAVAVDPERGRVAFAGDLSKPPLVTFHYGFSANVGGGEYDRTSSIDTGVGKVFRVANTFAATQGTVPTIQAALNALGLDEGAAIAGGLQDDKGRAVEIIDNGRYEELEQSGVKQPLKLSTARRLELRAGDKRRPTLALTKEVEISGDENSEVSLNGLLMSGAGLHVKSRLRLLRLSHCTIIAGAADQRGPNHAPALVVDWADVEIEIDDCIILGGLRISPDASVRVRNSIIDSTSELGVAYAAPGTAIKAGGSLRVENSTVVGKVFTTVLELASNSIFLARLRPSDGPLWRGPVQAEQRQKGCARFSYLPPSSRVPRRYRCQPEAGADETRIRPTFSSLRYGDPDYCQLSSRCPRELGRGADDESEMGVFHNLFQPQRESHLRARLDEYLRFGLEAGILYAS
ncbi:MAG: hypothetical protein ACJ74T_23125, partial [Pyrinomonadaceae bacterium]